MGSVFNCSVFRRMMLWEACLTASSSFLWLWLEASLCSTSSSVFLAGKLYFVLHYLMKLNFIKLTHIAKNGRKKWSKINLKSSLDSLTIELNLPSFACKVRIFNRLYIFFQNFNYFFVWCEMEPCMLLTNWLIDWSPLHKAKHCMH